MGRREVKLFEIRDGILSDGNLIRDAWRLSYDFSPWAKIFDRGLYKPVQRKIIERCLHVSTVKVAHLPGVPEAVYGFVVVEGPTVHYVYTKPENRIVGIARALIDACGKPVFCSHDTRIAPRHASRAIAATNERIEKLGPGRASQLFRLRFCPAFALLSPSEAQVDY